MKAGFLAMMRLFGTVYLQKNLASVVSNLGLETPEQLFNSMDSSLEIEKKKTWSGTRA